MDNKAFGSSRKRPLGLVVADDHHGVRTAVCDLLSAEFTILRQVADGEALLEAAAELRPDVVVTDVRMPALNGLEAARRILHEGWCEAIVVLASIGDAGIVKSALEIGVWAYVLKDDAMDELTLAIQAAFEKRRYLSSSLNRKQVH